MGLLGWAVVALVVAGVFAILGFGGVAQGFATVSMVLFGIFIVAFLALLFAAIFIGRKIL